FEKKYQEIFGHLPGARDVEIESLRVICSTMAENASAVTTAQVGKKTRTDLHRNSYFQDTWQEVPMFERANLASGHRLSGPALVFEQHSATVIETGWWAELDKAGALVLRTK
ncbi:MAG: hypothetical protein ACE5G1_02680, partial [bacterium]